MIRSTLYAALLISLAVVPMLAGTVVIDELGNAVINGFEFAGSGVIAPDPGPGGLGGVLTYNLPFPGVQGDVQITECGGACFLDVIRFNGNGTVLFYSDNVDGFDAPADTPAPPGAFYTNLASVPEIGDEFFSQAVYTPQPGQPGFDPSNPTYTFISEGSAVPEPASWVLVVAGIGAVSGWSRRKRAVRR